ncbi:MAG: hypothetical protein Q9180_008192 [Flavoplaca navasiana]
MEQDLPQHLCSVRFDVSVPTAKLRRINWDTKGQEFSKAEQLQAWTFTKFANGDIDKWRYSTPTGGSEGLQEAGTNPLTSNTSTYQPNEEIISVVILGYPTKTVKTRQGNLVATTIMKRESDSIG